MQPAQKHVDDTAMHACENTPSSLCCQLASVSHMHLWKNDFERRNKMLCYFLSVNFIGMYSYFFILKNSSTKVILFNRFLFCYLDCQEQIPSWKKIPNRMGAQIIHANVAINSSHAAHITGWPSVGARAGAEFKCGAQRGGMQAAAVNLEIITALSDGGAVHVKHQLTVFIC